jgi:hypothetical protein
MSVSIYRKTLLSSYKIEDHKTAKNGDDQYLVTSIDGESSLRVIRTFSSQDKEFRILVGLSGVDDAFPNIVIYGTLIDEKNRSFLVQRYFAGTSLAFTDMSSLSSLERKSLIAKIIIAMSNAKSVILHHNSLVPKNILVNRNVTYSSSSHNMSGISQSPAIHITGFGDADEKKQRRRRKWMQELPYELLSFCSRQLNSWNQTLTLVDYINKLNVDNNNNDTRYLSVYMLLFYIIDMVESNDDTTTANFDLIINSVPSNLVNLKDPIRSWYLKDLKTTKISSTGTLVNTTSHFRYSENTSAFARELKYKLEAFDLVVPLSHLEDDLSSLVDMYHTLFQRKLDHSTLECIVDFTVHTGDVCLPVSVASAKMQVISDAFVSISIKQQSLHISISPNRALILKFPTSELLYSFPDVIHQIAGFRVDADRDFSLFIQDIKLDRYGFNIKSSFMMVKDVTGLEHKVILESSPLSAVIVSVLPLPTELISMLSQLILSDVTYRIRSGNIGPSGRKIF